MSFFQALKDKTTELKEKTKARLGVATVKGKQQRDNVESIAGVDKARERHAQSTKPPGEGSTATRHGAFSGAATAATSLSAAFSKIGSSPYKKKGDERIVEYTEDASAGSSTQAPAEKHAEGVKSSVEDTLATLDQGFYLPEGEFDPVRHVLESISERDGDLTLEMLQKEEEQLSHVIEAVSTKLSREVLAHYDDFVQGMENISELTDNMEQSFVIVKNGRRNLTSAKESVSRALHVAESHAQKRSLMASLDMLVRVRECQSLDARIRSNLEASSYVDAVCEYASALKILRTLDGLKCAKTLGQDLRSLLWDIVQSVEAVLFDVCGDFQPKRYGHLFEAYLLMKDEVKPLGDKVQELFLQSVEKQTEGMLRLHSLQRGGISERDDEEAERKAKMGYRELCKQLSPTQFFPCFQKSLEVLFDLFCSHRRMLEWHEARIRSLGDGQEAEACKAVVAALARSRRAIADMAGGRIAALLQASSTPSSGHFKAVLDWSRVFIEAAEAFSGTQASTLRGHLERAGDRYFESLHAQRLEALCQMLDREVWARLPEVAAVQTREDLRAAAARGRRGASEEFSMAAFVGVAQDGSAFDALREKGNPFTNGGIGKAPSSVSGSSAKTSRTTGESSRVPVDDDEDEEDSAVSAAFIDEGDDEDDDKTVNPEVRRARREARAAAAAAEASATANGGDDARGLDARNPTLTASSLYLLQGTAEYLRLMRVLPPSMPVIFEGMCSLFETTLVRMFGAFGRHEALQPESDQITPRLRTTLNRLTNGTPLAALKPGQGGGIGSEAWSVLSSGNLYGLKERVIALESLACIAEELKRLKPGLKQTLSSSEEPKLERFYGQTIASVEDLREHVYCHVARLLLNLSWVSETIGDSDKLSDALKTGKYAKKEVSTDHNKWVNDLSLELTQFGAKLACAEVTPEALVMLWNYAISETAAAIVAGFARVRKCSSEGRAGMALDVQVLHGNIRHLAPKGCKLDFGFALEFVKAFYIPAAELEYWCQTHAEYSTSQRVALVNQIAGAFGWSSTAKSELLAKLGSREML